MHAESMWLIQNEIMEHHRTDIGGRFTRMTGGVMLYSITVRIPENHVAYQMKKSDREFVRYRRWSCMNELRLQVEKQLKENENYGRLSFIKKLPPYPFPAKSRLFKNKSTVAVKRSYAFGKWLSVLLAHESTMIVKTVQDWLSLPDDCDDLKRPTGRTRAPNPMEEINLKILQAEVTYDCKLASSLLAPMLADALNNKSNCLEKAFKTENYFNEHHIFPRVTALIRNLF
jgi:hypothetical protein